jgi:lipopolysaccharide transport system ATP-binding protein
MTAIEADRLGKSYRLAARASYGSLRDSLVRLASWRREARPAGDGILWALKDVSFEVADGEIVGIIGRNGSGKSTLLKILSRITEPTAGCARVRGRVGSLLEVGTGFHPELSGRENVLVNGAILGMKRTEILRKFDEIVAFADVEAFIDTPVKHYSSGMQMRLAFSVAAHLEPEILLVDEVLAVGDIAFQKKCLGKMNEVSKSGRTVLFVSHQTNQLRRLCNRCVWLERGQVRETGEAGVVVSRYEEALSQVSADDRHVTDPGSIDVTRFDRWDVGHAGGHVVSDGGPQAFRFWLRLARRLTNGHCGIALLDPEGRVVWGAGLDNLSLEPGVHVVEYEFASLPVRPGSYQWLLTLYDGPEPLDRAYCTPSLLVATVPTGHRMDEWAGVLNLDFTAAVRPDATSSEFAAPELVENLRAAR